MLETPSALCASASSAPSASSSKLHVHELPEVPCAQYDERREERVVDRPAKRDRSRAQTFPHRPPFVGDFNRDEHAMVAIASRMFGSCSRTHSSRGSSGTRRTVRSKIVAASDSDSARKNTQVIEHRVERDDRAHRRRMAARGRSAAR